MVTRYRGMGRACGLFALPLTSTTRPVPRIARFAANDIFISFGTKTCCASSAKLRVFASVFAHPSKTGLQEPCANSNQIQALRTRNLVRHRSRVSLAHLHGRASVLTSRVVKSHHARKSRGTGASETREATQDLSPTLRCRGKRRFL